MSLNDLQKKERSEYLENNLHITECSQKKPFAFISYASDNWETVFKRAIVPMQQQYGLCVYADKAFDKVNDKWIVPMLRNVRGSELMIAFVSQSYIESYACFLELLTAVNNKKQIVFVSLGEELHLGDTTDQPIVERGVKNEILNLGANIATNTNNSSNDLMRAMKSAFTGISTFLEQDSLSKYDISDAFINFFRDASVNMKTINDIGALTGTVRSVSKKVFDTSQLNKDIRHTQAEAAVPRSVPEARSYVPSQSLSHARDVSQPISRPAAEAVNSGYMPPVRPVHNKKLAAILIGCGCCLVLVVGAIIMAVMPKNVTDKLYSTDMIAVNGIYTYMEGTYTGKWKNNMPYGDGTLTLIDGYVYSGEWENGKANGQGRLTYADGSVYEGEWKNNRFDGQGRLTLADGGVYEGEFKNNFANGQGKITYADGDVYEGEWKDDMRNGYGVYTFASGDIYEGEFKDSMFNGKGKQTYASGDVYEGEFKDDMRNGYGVCTDANKSVYEGEWKDDKKNGQGTCTYPNGDGYEGEFKDNMRNGYGVYTYADGSIDEGEFKDGILNGQAKVTLANGTVFEGEYKDDLLNGQGKVTLADGTVFEGEFKDDLLNGQGKVTYVDGDVYDGEWKDSKKDGYGVYTFANGDVYEGEFKDSAINGQGKMTYADGSVEEGEWKDGEFIG